MQNMVLAWYHNLNSLKTLARLTLLPGAFMRESIAVGPQCMQYVSLDEIVPYDLRYLFLSRGKSYT